MLASVTADLAVSILTYGASPPETGGGISWWLCPLTWTRFRTRYLLLLRTAPLTCLCLPGTKCPQAPVSFNVRSLILQGFQWLLLVASIGSSAPCCLDLALLLVPWDPILFPLSTLVFPFTGALPFTLNLPVSLLESTRKHAVWFSEGSCWLWNKHTVQ